MAFRLVLVLALAAAAAAQQGGGSQPLVRFDGRVYPDVTADGRTALPQASLVGTG